MTTTHSRNTLERWAQRLNVALEPADRQTCLDAASRNEPIPRWQLESPRTGHRDDVRAFQSLAEVAEALDQRGITLGREDAVPTARIAPFQDWAPPVDGGKRLGERLAQERGATTQGPADQSFRRRDPGLSL